MQLVKDVGRHERYVEGKKLKGEKKKKNDTHPCPHILPWS